MTGPSLERQGVRYGPLSIIIFVCFCLAALLQPPPPPPAPSFFFCLSEPLSYILTRRLFFCHSQSAHECVYSIWGGGRGRGRRGGGGGGERLVE